MCKSVNILVFRSYQCYPGALMQIVTTLDQSIIPDLEMPNLLFFEKVGVLILNLQYFCMCITNKTECSVIKQGIKRQVNNVITH